MSSVSQFPVASLRASVYLHERSAADAADGPPDQAPIESWQRSAFLDDRVFDIRLSAVGLSRTAFGKLITDAFDVPDAVLDWADELSAVLAVDIRDVSELSLSTKLYSQGFDRLLFSGLLHPFLSYYESRLQERLSSTPVGDRLRASLLETLANRLLNVCARTLLLELNVARIHGRLQGETPEHRYDYYDRVQLTDAAYRSALFGEYPVLGRCMIECGRSWVTYVAELFERFAADGPLLTGAGLLAPSAGELTAVRLDLGDPHNGGRAVARLTFADGTDLIYKPRPVHAERAYADTLAELTRSGLTVPVSAPRVLAQPRHGWCEFVRRADCADADELIEFYRRAGSVLAAMLLLGAGDMHMENIIAAGPHFMPIDLETILQHGIPAGDATDAYGRAVDLLNQSVLANGILPARVFGGRKRQSVDVSAIGGGLPQAAPRPVPTVVDVYTDVARIEAVEATMVGALNRPAVAGVELRPQEHTEKIVAGFVEAYDIMAANRGAFTRLLEGFRDVEVRYLPRPTRRYSLFLSESYHPDHLRNAADRDRLLDKLWTAADARLDLIPVIESEKRQLLAGDIPCFRSSAGTRGIRAGDGELDPLFFDAPATTTLAGRLALFGPVHRAAQVRIIRDSMGTLTTQPSSVASKPSRTDGAVLDREIAADLADGLARRLADEAILGADDVSWIGVSIEGIQQETFSYKPLGTGLYDGVAGLALTYAYAARQLGNERYLDLAHRAAAPVVGYLRYLAEHRIVETTGAYSGIGGLLYALDHVAHATGERSYLEAIDEALPWLRECATQEECPDLIAGLAGCAVVSLGLHRRHGISGYRDVAAICGERLAGSVVDVDGAAGWYSPQNGSMLGGFSHGSAGVAWPLFVLADESGDSSLRDLAQRAVDFDRNLYVPSDGAWCDLRPEMADTAAYPALWCHGAGGIGLSRLLMLRHRNDEHLLAEAQAAMALVAANGFGHNHSLCHGDFGSLALFDLAERVLPEGAAASPGHDALAGMVVRDVHERGVLSGLAGGIQMPGLMLGVAGACLSLLRVAWPADVPAVAWLEMPDERVAS